MQKIIFAILSLIFVIIAFINGPHFSSILFIVCAIIVLPLPIFERFFDYIHKANLIPVILSFAIAFLGLSFSPNIFKLNSNTATGSKETLFITDTQNFMHSSENTGLISSNSVNGNFKSNSSESVNSVKKPAASEKESTTSSEIKEHLNIKLISLTSPVNNGQTAEIKIKGEPNTVYSIGVYYASKSSAAGLEDKKSDKLGNVSWSWRVGSRTKPGTYKIIISNNNAEFETAFTVE